jgi:sterol desaturase/sphingolipid hydroxylase (fatty acid hydroxylase superfamily)
MRNEFLIRLSCFGGIFLACAAWELLAPKRAFTTPRPFRWFNNLTLMALASLLLRVSPLLLAVDAAILSEERGWGLLRQVNWPFPVEPAVSLLFLDLVIYLQHAAFHKIAWLWRLHKVHHSDVDLDVTTAVRFHPIEIALSMMIKIGAVLLIGADAGDVILFEVILNATALFNHADIRMPQRLDAALRLFVVTPDMHRVHHSVEQRETDSNYGFNVPWWDRLFGTYRAQPRLGHAAMTLGLSQYQIPRRQHLGWLLALPFSRQ